MTGSYINLLQLAIKGVTEVDAKKGEWALEFMPQVIRIMNASAKGFIGTRRFMRERASAARKQKPKRGKWKR